MFRRWILPVLLILAAGLAGAWAIANRGGDPLGGGRGPKPEDAPPPPKLPVRMPPFAVLFGGELAGRLWVPPCSQFRQGGLGRIGPVVRDLASSFQIAMVLDTGDVAGAPGQVGEEELQAGLSALGDCGLAVGAVGEKDLAVGLERWRALKGRLDPQLRLVCANLRDDGGLALVAAVAHLQVGRLKVLVTAVLSPSYEKELRAAGVPVRILPPVAAVRDALTEAGKADFVILLAHTPEGEARALVKAIPEADLFLTAHGGPLPWKEPEVIDGRTLLYPGAGWQFVSAAAFRDAGEGRKPELTVNDSRMVSGSADINPGLRVLADMALLKIRQPGFLEAALKECADHRPAGEGACSGPEACATCHPAAHGEWIGDPHAKSMKSVRTQQFDAAWNCLTCHTTAPGMPGGHLQRGDSQEAVTCEACHGPGAAHVASDGRVRLGDARASCARCHIPEMSPGFRFEERWAKIAHGR